MFGELSASYGNLSEEQRTMLAELLSIRNEYFEQVTELNKLRIKVLTNPTPKGEAELREYASAMVAPVRGRMSEQMAALLIESVDVDSLKGMLPMVLLALTQSINLPLLLTTLNLEPDMIEQLVGRASEYFKNGA